MYEIIDGDVFPDRGHASQALSVMIKKYGHPCISYNNHTLFEQIFTNSPEGYYIAHKGSFSWDVHLAHNAMYGDTSALILSPQYAMGSTVSAPRFGHSSLSKFLLRSGVITIKQAATLPEHPPHKDLRQWPTDHDGLPRRSEAYFSPVSDLQIRMKLIENLADYAKANTMRPDYDFHFKVGVELRDIAQKTHETYYLPLDTASENVFYDMWKKHGSPKLFWSTH